MGRILLIGVGVIAALTLGMYVLGASTPVEHEVSRTLMLNQPVDEIWNLITDYENGPNWRPELDEVRRIEDQNGNPVWLEIGDYGEMPLEVVASVPNERLELRIADDSLPWGGVWIYEFESADGGTQLTITEDGFVRMPFFRFLNHYVFGPDATIKQYLTNLAVHYGEEPQFIE